jgi:RimJ/RimL family protein N-acetyltransferase
VLIDVPPSRRGALRPLFNGFPGLNGCLDAVLDGAMGTARTDDAHRPRVALLDLDFYLLSGDAGAPAAEAAVRSLEPPFSVATPAGPWHDMLRNAWGEQLQPYTRVEFDAPLTWDRPRLQSLIDALPDGFRLRRVTGVDAARFRELADSLVYNFASLEEFIMLGAGFGVEHDGRFVSGCSSFAISSHSLEFEIQTHPDFRERGFAQAAAAAMIQHCIDQRLTACWDAHNPISAALATKLGFVNPRPYTAFQCRDDAGADP